MNSTLPTYCLSPLFRQSILIIFYHKVCSNNQMIKTNEKVTDELHYIFNEFKTKLTTIRGCIDGLEVRVSELEVTQFSTTTK
ncbi:hypothetical protein CREGCYN_07810 [Synechococcus sp. M16CYN]